MLILKNNYIIETSEDYQKLKYRGMHEILAPVIFVVHFDHQALLHTQENSSVQEEISIVVDPNHLEEDSYTLFRRIMNAIEGSYLIANLAPTSTGYFPKSPQMANSNENQVISQLNWIKERLLAPTDPELHSHLENLDIPLPLFGIRWLRLLFGREFPLHDLLVLWDAIFAEDNSFDLVNYIVVAMLVAIRHSLLQADCLTMLMRYPPNGDISCIIEYALHLKNPSLYKIPEKLVFNKKIPSKNNYMIVNNHVNYKPSKIYAVPRNYISHQDSGKEIIDGFTLNGCGCHCRDCGDHSGLHLHVEIENLKQQLLEKENHILTMETNFLKEADKFPNGEMAAISEELLTWQDKYSRLYEAHKRVQKVNQNLEDKLLRIVDKCETEKNSLTNEVSNLTKRLVDEKFNVTRLQEENERYRNDVNLAIQLLQCKPSNFVSQKYDSLPCEMQQKVRMYMSSKRRQSDGNGNIQPKSEMKTIKVPIPTYPPTAMVYSINKGTIEKDSDDKPNHPVDIVSSAIMAKILEEREKERSHTKHCDTCTCSKPKTTKSTQTMSDPTDKSINPSVLPFIKSNKLILTNLKGKNIEKDKLNVSESSFSPSDRIKEGKISYPDGWETEDTTDLRRKSPLGVTEGILVNIDSTENSSINSATSECSSLSWQSKMGNTPKKNVDDLITFDKPKNECEKIQGPRHCSVRLQAEV